MKFNNNSLLLVILFISLFSTQNIFAQNNGSISGTVIDKMSQQKLPYANVIILGSDKAVATDSVGSHAVVRMFQ